MPVDPRAKKPLAPKVIKTHPYEPIWASLERMGHRPLPSIAKHPPLMDWPRVPTDAKARSQWPLRARDKDTGEWRDVGAGVQMVDGLLVFDVDVTDLIWRSIVTETIEEIAPGALEQMVARHSGAASIALFARTEPGFKTLAASRGYAETEGGDRVARVELFAGAIAKHVATHGPHAKPEREYGYLGRRLEDVAIADLPLITQAQAWAILKRAEEKFDEVLVRHGDRIETGDSLRRVYDLEPGMLFRLEDGEDVELTELQERLTDKGLYGYATLWDPTSDRKDRAKAVSASSGLMIIDWHTMIGHCWKHLAPPSLEDLAVRLRAIQDRQDGGAGGDSPPATSAPPASSSAEPPKRPPPGDLMQAVDYVFEAYAFLAGDKQMVVELNRPAAECVYSFPNWRAQHHDLRVVVPPQGQQRVPQDVHPCDLWMMGVFEPALGKVVRSKMVVEGVQMRPDQPFPVFAEHGKLYKNTFLKPVHVGDGGTVLFEAFLMDLIPDHIEREWFIDWLAHKWRFPHIPGVAIVMVAADKSGKPVYGTGRGRLEVILSKLFGGQYVTPIDIDVLTGKSTQAPYTDWAAYSLLATATEAKDSPEDSRHNVRRATYETLKKMVDPANNVRTFAVKYGKPFRAPCFCSFLIASNNIDALQIPEDDRRFTVLRNGLPLKTEHAKALMDWADQPGNIAALARWLEKRDLSGFDAFTPLATKTKSRMQDLAKTDLDDGFEEAHRRLAPVFRKDDVWAIVSDHLGGVTRAGAHEAAFNRMFRQRTELAGGNKNDARAPRDLGRGLLYVWMGGLDPTSVSREDRDAMARASAKAAASGNAAMAGLRVPDSDPA